MVYPQTVTRPSINPVRRRVTIGYVDRNQRATTKPTARPTTVDGVFIG